MVRVLMDLVGWLGVLVSMAGAAASAFAIGRTRWAIVLLAGFAGEAVTGVFYRLVPHFFSMIASGSAQTAYFLGGVFGLLSHATVVAGVVGVLFFDRRAA